MSLPKVPRKTSAADVGILGRRKAAGRESGGVFFFTNEVGRREQDCGTCEPNLCGCIVRNEDVAYGCASELNAVCNRWMWQGTTEFTVEGCDAFLDERSQYYRNVQCPFAECTVDEGMSPVMCQCVFYEAFCDAYRDDPDTEVSE